MSAPDSPSARPLLLGRASAVAFAVSSIAGAIAAVSGSPALDPGALAGALLLLALSLGLGLCPIRGDRRGVAAYLALQTALAVALMALTRGRSALALMPLVSQSVLVLPRAGVAAYSALLGAAFLAGLSRDHAVSGLAGAGFSYFTASLFTWAFTALAVRERDARQEVERLAAALREATGEVERLAVEGERNRLARELHDGLGHALTVAHVQLEAARAVLRIDPQKAERALLTAGRMLQEGLRDLRQSVSTLREQAGPPESLPELIQGLVRGGEEALPAVRLEIAGEVRRLEPAAELALFRAAQEGLTNARRHASATRVRLRLTFAAGETTLEVADDGRNSPTLEGGFGLVGIRERVELLGGTVEPERGPSGGLTLRVRVPFPAVS